MRGVGGEATLGLEAPLEPVEHVVERLDEPTDLVSRPWVGQALGEVRLADAPSLRHHVVDWPEGAAGEQGAG